MEVLIGDLVSHMDIPIIHLTGIHLIIIIIGHGTTIITIVLTITVPIMVITMVIIPADITIRAGYIMDIEGQHPPV
jgi:hypothetical protein